MKATRNLKNLDELKARQALLIVQQTLVGQEIVRESKAALVALPAVSLLKPADPLRIIKVDGKINIPAKVISYLLPLVVNRTLFRRSGFLTRFIVTMIARRIGIRMGPKVAIWLLSTIENYLSSRKPHAPGLPGHILQHTGTLPAKRLK